MPPLTTSPTESSAHLVEDPAARSLRRLLEALTLPVAPDMRGAACTGQWRLYESRIPGETSVERADRVSQAQALCSNCPVTAECARLGAGFNRHGAVVWGGELFGVKPPRMCAFADCGQWFIPERDAQEYHSPRCAVVASKRADRAKRRASRQFTRTCEGPGCSEVFTTNRSEHRFHHRECWSASRSSPTSTRPVKQPKQKVTQPKRQVKPKRAPEPPVRISCEECRFLFTPVRCDQRYCGRGCWNKRRARLAREKRAAAHTQPPQTARCDHCGTEYPVTRRNRRYCGGAWCTRDRERRGRRRTQDTQAATGGRSAA